MDENFKTIKAWCAACQDDIAHHFWTDHAGELILSCFRCAHFIKVPTGVQAGALARFLAAHRTANSGMVTAPSEYESAQDVQMYKPIESPKPIEPVVPVSVPKKKWWKR